jgi:hypothetical protein
VFALMLNRFMRAAGFKIVLHILEAHAACDGDLKKHSACQIGIIVFLMGQNKVNILCFISKHSLPAANLLFSVFVPS